MPTLTTITPSKGTPIGGQVVTATGAWTATTGTVTVDGRTASVASFAAGSVTFTVPGHRDGSGNLVSGGGTVAVVVSPTAQGTYTGTYTYTATLAEKAFDAVRSRVAQRTKAGGDFYDIGAHQVQSFKKDQTADTGAAWPQVIVFQATTDYSGGQDDTYGFFTGRIQGTAQAAIPLGEMEDWNLELNWLVADLFRSVMLARLDMQNSIANDVRVDSTYIGQVTDPQAGAIGVAVVEFTVELKHVHNDMTTNTEYTP